jgi:hypothetical protein
VRGQEDEQLEERLLQRIEEQEAERDARIATLSLPVQAISYQVIRQEELRPEPGVRRSRYFDYSPEDATYWLWLTERRNPEPEIVIFAMTAATPFLALAWLVLLAFLTRGGLSYAMAEIALVRSDGRPAGRFRCTARTLLAAAPLAILFALSVGAYAWCSLKYSGDTLSWLPLISSACWYAAVMLGLLYLVMGLRWPQGSPLDRLVGIYLVPK